MSDMKYDPKKAQYVFEVNARLGIPEEQTALAIAQNCGRGQEFQEALKDRKKGSVFRRHAEDINSLLERVCVMPREYSSTVIKGKYVLMAKTSTYAQGVHALQNFCKAAAHTVHPQFTQDDGSLIYRPLTFKETIEGRVSDYESNKDTPERLRLFQRWNDSCTAVAYKKGTTKFKIVPVSPELITIPADFDQSYMKIDYDGMEGIKLDRNDAVYNNLLTPAQVETHPAWLTALEEDTLLLKAYRDIVFAEKKTETAMGFWVRTEISEAQLRALFVSGLNLNSNAYGDGSLCNGGSFLHVAPVK